MGEKALKLKTKLTLKEGYFSLPFLIPSCERLGYQRK